MSEQPLSPAEKAQIATRIGQLDEQAAQHDANIATLQRFLETAKAKDRDSMLAQIATARSWRSAVLEEANMLRAQIGLPLVIPTTPQAITQERPQVVKKRGCGTKIAIVLILLVIAGFFELGRGSSSSPSMSSRPARRTAAPTQNYTEIDVRELKKNPSRFIGDPIRLKGKVFNIQESGGHTSIQMWVPVPGGDTFDREAVAVSYGRTLSGVFEETEIDVLGVGAGEMSGENAMGGTISQPLIDADVIRKQ